MKKSLIALAVASAVAAPAFAATSNVDVYGVINVAIQDTNGKNAAGADNDVTMGVVDNVSRIGFKGSEDLGGGMKAIWQIEQGLSAAPDANAGVGSGTLATRNTFIGLSGGFGTFVMGRHDTPYKMGTGSLDIFGDTIGDYNTGRADTVQLISNAHDARSPSAVAYISPTWSGFHFAAAMVAADQTAVGVTDDKAMDAISLTGVYSNGPLFASLSYQELGDAGGLDATNDAWKLGVGYTFGDTKVGFVYEDIDTGSANTDRDSWLLNVAHTMGPIVLKAQYGRVDQERVGSDANQKAWMLGADYNLSKRTSAYFVWAHGDDDSNATNDGSASGYNIGLKHSF